MDRYGKLRAALERAVLDGPGHTDARLRAAVATRRDVPTHLRALVDKIHDAPHTVTDADLGALRDAHDEDVLFEIVVASSLGAALHRLHAGLRAVRG
ncbi:MAG: hypothetical protein IPJ34_28050 [Myxococcales bacterium]|nr:hypothetical protein [Myxococcales bacterium]